MDHPFIDGIFHERHQWFEPLSEADELGGCRKVTMPRLTRVGTERWLERVEDELMLVMLGNVRAYLVWVSSIKNDFKQVWLDKTPLMLLVFTS